MSFMLALQSPAIWQPFIFCAIFFTDRKSSSEDMGETRLYYVYSQALELIGDPELLLRGHAAARGLLAVPKRRVEYVYVAVA